MYIHIFIHIHTPYTRTHVSVSPTVQNENIRMGNKAISGALFICIHKYSFICTHTCMRESPTEQHRGIGATRLSVALYNKAIGSAFFISIHTHTLFICIYICSSCVYMYALHMYTCISSLYTHTRSSYVYIYALHIHTYTYVCVCHR